MAARAGVRVVLDREPGPLPKGGHCLVRWGSLRGSDRRFERVVNRKPALRIAYDPALAAHRLRLNGLEPMTKRAAAKDPAIRLYRVDVFDLEPLTIRRLRQGRGLWQLEPVRRASPRELERAASAAVRALHALGLDAGRADVALLPPANGLLREGVCAVNPAPDWSGALGYRLLPALRRLRYPERPPEAHWVFGADPELMLIDPVTGHYAPASQFLPRRGAVGCDAQTAGGNPPVRPLAELRPEPTADALALVPELRRCLRLLEERLASTPLIWRAGSQPVEGFGVGGHIHFSGGSLTGPLLRALDTYLAVPVMLIENPAAAAARRRRHGYLGDVRFKGHGGFEYRTLPSWLVSPKVARAVLALAAWVINDHPFLPTDLFLATELMEAFYRAEKEPFYAAWERLRSDLLASPSSGRWVPAVEPLFELIECRQTWDEGADLRRTWWVGVQPQRRLRAVAVR